MRKISANYVFPVSSPPVKNGIIVLDDQDRIKDIVNPGNYFREMSGLEYYNGILVPSFIVFAEYAGTGSSDDVEKLFYRRMPQFKEAGCKIVLLSFGGSIYFLDIPAGKIRTMTPEHLVFKSVFTFDKDKIISLFDFFPSSISHMESGGLQLFTRQLKQITLDAAGLLGLQEEAGSMDIDKSPGIQLISPYDFERWYPAQDAHIKMLVR